MPTQIYDRNDLIAILRYQFEIGIDEALLDFPDASAAPVTLRELLAQKYDARFAGKKPADQ